MSVQAKSRTIRRIGILVLTLMIEPIMVEAQTTQTLRRSEQSLKPLNVERSTPISIKINTSRPRSTAGGGLGVVAEIQNISDSAVYLVEKHTVLVLPPEMQSPVANYAIEGIPALFPTEYAVRKGDREDRDAVYIILNSGDSYRIFWTTESWNGRESSGPVGILGLSRSVIRRIMSELYFIFFPPGDYTITVALKYWSSFPFETTNYRTVVQSAVIPVAAPDFVILFGASIGGLIAYFIFPQARSRVLEISSKKDSVIFHFSSQLLGILGAMLLSTIVTILLSRVAETQFLIRITVNDFWGAVTVGFIANYVGARVLDRFLPSEGSALERKAVNIEAEKREVLRGQAGTGIDNV
jgi:hypothetical protein